MAAQNVISVTAKRSAIREVLRKLPSELGGAAASAAREQLLTRIGLAALGSIKAAFVQKARGEADDTGLKWAPLKKSSIAYGRRHPGVLWPGKKRAPFRPSWMLTDKQRKRWWQLNAIGGPAYAWMVVKQEGGRTLIGEYGDTPVEILRDTGLLLNSLSPGVPGGVPDQVFRIEQAAVVVGTNRKFAGAHHRGIPGKLPRRPLWPSPSNWTPAYWRDILEVARDGLIEVTLFLLRNKAA